MAPNFMASTAVSKEAKAVMTMTPIPGWRRRISCRPGRIHGQLPLCEAGCSVLLKNTCPRVRISTDRPITPQDRAVLAGKLTAERFLERPQSAKESFVVFLLFCVRVLLSLLV